MVICAPSDAVAILVNGSSELAGEMENDEVVHRRPAESLTSEMQMPGRFSEQMVLRRLREKTKASDGEALIGKLLSHYLPAAFSR